MFLEYTKTVDGVYRALWLTTQSRDIQCYSLIHVQLLRASDSRKLRAKWFPDLLPQQIIKQAVPEIHEKDDELRFGSFTR